MNLQDHHRQEIVNQLTAIGLILFELIESLEDRYPDIAQEITNGTNDIITLIQDLVIDEYEANCCILTTPKLNVDASLHENMELEDLDKLVGYLEVIKGKLSGRNEVLCTTAQHSLHKAVIDMIQTIRPSFQEVGESKDPWDYLRETMN
jgi:hypothetical protein